MPVQAVNLNTVTITEKNLKAQITLHLRADTEAPAANL
jgi:hypothetical protein